MGACADISPRRQSSGETPMIVYVPLFKKGKEVRKCRE
jgi:hypothetical protein